MDVVLYAKNIDKPDLNVLEISLVKIASESDQFVEVKDKIIVALTQGEKNLRNAFSKVKRSLGASRRTRVSYYTCVFQS